MRMEEVKDFRTTILEMISSDKIENQKELSQVYESLVQDFSHQQKIKYIEKPINLTKRDVKITIEHYFNEPIYKKFLQKKNIVLSPTLWRYIMLAQKRNVMHDYKVVADKDEKTVQLSQLKYGELKGKPIFILRLAELKFDEKKLATTDNIMLKAMFNLKGIMFKAKPSSIDDLENVIKDCSQFAVHEYYLPNGLVDEECLNNAVLLYRYEKVYARENDSVNQQSGHTNYGLPFYYKLIYPKTISYQRLVKESHMHFAEGVGAMHRLDDVSERKNKQNLNAGYAIPVSFLKKYLKCLIKDQYQSEEHRRFFYENDFGMHFLYLIRRMPNAEILLEFMNNLDLNDSPTKDLKRALDFMDIVSGLHEYINNLDKEPIL